MEVKDAQIERMEEENRQWKERNGQLLTKYDCIDLKQLKDQIEDLQIDLKKASEEKEALPQEVRAVTKAVSFDDNLRDILLTRLQG